MPIQKTASLKSVYIRLDDAPRIDLQYIETWTVDGELLQTVHLPDTRLDPANLSAEDREKVEAALGVALVSVTAERDAAHSQIEVMGQAQSELQVQLGDAQNAIQDLQAQISAAQERQASLDALPIQELN